MKPAKDTKTTSTSSILLICCCSEIVKQNRTDMINFCFILVPTLACNSSGGNKVRMWGSSLRISQLHFHCPKNYLNTTCMLKDLDHRAFAFQSFFPGHNTEQVFFLLPPLNLNLNRNRLLHQRNNGSRYDG